MMGQRNIPKCFILHHDAIEHLICIQFLLAHLPVRKYTEIF